MVKVKITTTKGVDTNELYAADIAHTRAFDRRLRMGVTVVTRHIYKKRLAHEGKVEIPEGTMVGINTDVIQHDEHAVHVAKTHGYLWLVVKLEISNDKPVTTHWVCDDGKTASTAVLYVCRSLATGFQTRWWDEELTGVNIRKETTDGVHSHASA